jgi:Ca-activated chloride channel homolog
MPNVLSRRAAALLAVGLLVVTSAPAGRAQTAAARERTLFVSAVDSKGEPIDNLRVNDVVVREDGARREVLRISQAVEPIDIALLVDNSAAAEDAISHVREALKRFVGTMAADNQIAIVALADRPTIFVDYTSDRKRLDDGIGRLFSMATSGATLLDALFEVSTGLRKRETPRAVIVPIVTDGIEFSNRYHRDVIDAVKSANAPVHAVAIGNFELSNEQALRERALVLDMGTKESGGQRVTVLAPQGVGNALDKLARELSSQYKVVYGRPESLIPPQKLEISSARTGVTIRGTAMRGQPGA